MPRQARCRPVTDNRGNAYVLAVGPTVQLGFGTQSIYYAANIAAAAADANTVTVTFAAGVPYADIRIAEYSGIAAGNPVDVVAAGSGNSALSDSGAGDDDECQRPDRRRQSRVVADDRRRDAPLRSRIITTPDGDILEDRIVDRRRQLQRDGAVDVRRVDHADGGVQGRHRDAGHAGADGAGALAANASRTQIEPDVECLDGQRRRSPAIASNVARAPGCSKLCPNRHAAGTATAFSDTGLAAGTSYTYRVRASDAAGNLGAYSPVSSATTQAPDTEPPSAPGPLTATAVSGTQIDVSWGAATDNVGVAGYRLERCQGVGCSAFTKLGTTIAGTSFRTPASA